MNKPCGVVLAARTRLDRLQRFLASFMLMALPGLTLVEPAMARQADHATLERVVIVMRHGVRPPTKAKPLPDGYTPRAWPAWPVAPGWLTPHGEAAVVLAAQFDANSYRAVIPAHCPRPAQVQIVADTDQRAQRTAQVYADTLFARCHVAVETVGAGQRDPRFSPFEAGATLDPAQAAAAVLGTLPAGGTGALDVAEHTRLAQIDAVLGCCAPPACAGQAACHLTDMPLTVSADKGRVRITGGIATAASFAQTLLLEYAEGKPMADVGWGQVTPAMITDLSSLHALEYTLTARPPLIAKAGAAALLRAVASALRDPAGPAFALFVGHDTNLALIGGALDVHWQGRGFAADDPGPGAALVFELWRGADGGHEVRLRYRSQSLDEIRQLSPLAPDDTRPLVIPACHARGACSLAAFSELVGALAAH